MPSQLIRSASLTGFRALCLALNADPARLAAAAGVPTRALEDADLKVDTRRVGKLLDLAAEKTGAEDFGLRLAEARRLSNLGPVGLIVRDQPSLRRVLDVLRQYLWLHNEALSLTLDTSDEIAVAHIDFAASRRGVSRQAIELSVGVLCVNLRGLLGSGWKPEATCFRHRAPSNLSVHRRVFRRTPRFEQEFDGLVLPRADLDVPLVNADPLMASQIERYVERSSRARATAMSTTVGDLIILLLPTGTCCADRVATHLGMDRRTLHRQLTAEGTTFRALLDDRRASLAISLLRAERSCTAVAEMTGFSSISTFSHWFRRHFGKTPSAYLRTAVL